MKTMFSKPLFLSLLASCLPVFSESNTPSEHKPLLIHSDRNSTVYLTLTASYLPAAECLHIKNTIITSTKEQTFSVDVSVDAKGIEKKPIVTDTLERNLSFKKPMYEEALPRDTIVQLPLRGADLLGIKICHALHALLPSKDKPLMLLEVWQGVAIDPAFRYQVWDPACDYVIVENGLYQSADITQTITDPNQLLMPENWHTHQPAPSHGILFKNAVARTTMPSNANSVRHKLFLMYASDAHLLSRESLSAFAEYDWTIILLGDSSTSKTATAELFNMFKVQFAYVDCFNKTQSQLQDEIVRYYLNKVGAQ